MPLDVYFLPTQTAQLPHGVFSTRICASNRSASVKPIRKAATSHAKQKRQRFHPYRLMFILSNADDTTSTRRFFYSNLCIELFRQCGLIPIMQSSNAKQKRQGFTRICASNCSASADNSNLANPSGKLLHSRKAKRYSPLDIYFLPTQTARLPHGVFSTRICASNRSANADTWEIIPTMQS